MENKDSKNKETAEKAKKLILNLWPFSKKEKFSDILEEIYTNQKKLVLSQLFIKLKKNLILKK